LAMRLTEVEKGSEAPDKKQDCGNPEVLLHIRLTNSVLHSTHWPNASVSFRAAVAESTQVPGSARFWRDVKLR
jgi:hypothetical protein